MNFNAQIDIRAELRRFARR